MVRLNAFHELLRAGIATARRNRLIRSGVGVGGLTGAELVLGLATGVLLARSLGAGGLGTYSLTLAAVMLAGLLVEFGLPTLVMREIAHHDSKMEAGAVKGVLIFAIVVIVLMSVVIMPLAFVLGDMLAPRLDEAESLILPIALILIPVSALCNTFGAALSGMQRVVMGSISQKLLRPGVFAIALVAVSVLEPGWLTPARAMALQLAASVAALAFSGFVFLRCFSGMLGRLRARIFWRTWGLSMLRLGLTNGIRLAEGQILLLMTGALTSAENVGLLRVAQRGAGVVSLGAAISAIVCPPQFVRLNAEGKHDRLQHLLTQAARAGSGVALIGLIGFAVAGHWLLATFFGTEFVAAWSALMILAAAETGRALFGLGGVLLNMLRYEKTTLFGLVISLAISVSITAALVPVYGVDGAAWGIFFGVSVMSAFFWHKARRIVNLDSSTIGWPVVRDNSGGQL